jgi:hypothetical protein
MTTPLVQDTYINVPPNETRYNLNEIFLAKNTEVYLKTGDSYKKINKRIDYDNDFYAFREEDGGFKQRPITNLYYKVKSNVNGGKSRRRIRKRRQKTKRRSSRRNNKRR